MRFCLCGFREIAHGLLTCSIDGREVDDDIAGLVDEVPEHCVDASRSVVYKDAGIYRSIEVFRDGSPRLVQ